jgi:predicted RNase H-related nuclease YkuK (DUF458 family)
MNYDLDVMRRYDNKKEINISEFCQEIKNVNTSFEVYVGTDSQFIAGKTYYTTVIAFRFGNKGVRGIYRTLIESQNVLHLHEKKKKLQKSNTDRKKTYNNQIYERLRRETELSIETANHVKDFINIKQIDLDYNSKAVCLSNSIVAECWALCSSYGFKVSIKGQEQVATPFADKICK